MIFYDLMGEANGPTGLLYTSRYFEGRGVFRAAAGRLTVRTGRTMCAIGP
jgi:hypothetical protein